MPSAVSRGLGFFARQDSDWKITVFRTNLSMFLHKIVLPYLSIYIMALGATGTQLGIANGIGMLVAGLAGPISGLLIDRTGIRKVYLVGIVILAMSYLLYGVAQSWHIIIAALVAYWLGHNTSVHTCAVICANRLKSHERATGMAICETFGMGLLGLVAPMLGAILVTAFGGLNVEGIRPLFFVCLVGIVGTFFLILARLSNHSWASKGSSSVGLTQGFFQVFEQGANLKRWLVVASVTGLPMGVVLPFVQPFAHEFKGADQYVLGAMLTASALTPLLLGIPMGRLADRIGRKKVILATIPFVWASYLMLMYAPGPTVLIVSGAFQGFFMISTITTEAMSRELVPPEYMGRWTGVVRLCRMSFAALIVYLAGIMWDTIGPQYIFVAIMALDFVRVPLLLTMPETLGAPVSLLRTPQASGTPMKTN